MPFYEYQCRDCEHKLEVLQKISDEPLVYCPECNQASLKKLISAAAFRLKGTGWYETDFKNNDKKKENSENNQSSAAKSKDGAAKDSAKSDTSKPKSKDSSSTSGSSGSSSSQSKNSGTSATV